MLEGVWNAIPWIFGDYVLIRVDVFMGTVVRHLHVIETLLREQEAHTDRLESAIDAVATEVTLASPRGRKIEI